MKYYAGAYTDHVTICKEGGQDIRDMPNVLVYHAWDLLAALKRLQEYTCQERECVCNECIPGTVCPPCQVRAAIAKAEGCER